MYTRSELIAELIDGFDVFEHAAEPAVNIFLEKVRVGSYTSSAILDENKDDVFIEGDLETDAEHVYSTQWYWDNQEPETPLRGMEVIELPNEDKLLEEDGER